MKNEPQHIRRRCTTRTYDAVERGEKTFEVFVGDDVQLEPNDLLTLDEWESETKKYTGRRVTRKISHVLNTKRAGFPDDEVARHGVTICGTVHPDMNTLHAMLHETYIASIIIERVKDGRHNVLTGPFYLPPMSAPPAYELGLFDDLHPEKWPLGVYDITISLFPDQKRDRFVIIDHLINGAVYTDDGDILAVELEHASLLMGKVKDLTGKQLQLADPAEVKGLQDVDDDESVDVVPDESLVPMRLQDGMSRRVEDELDSLLDEAWETEAEETDAD